VDRWATWLLETRFGGDEAQHARTLEFLRPIRDHVVANARIRRGDVVLDVGTGDGLIAFAALDLVGAGGRVIFSDISDDLLTRCRELAGGDTRADFVHTSADDLAAIPTESVDVVTTRSVLIYVADKERAFAEFFRVLRPGGRLSIFEPINRWYREARPETEFWGFDASAVHDLTGKLIAEYEAAQPSAPEESPMLDFDERDLLRLARETGFDAFRLEYEVTVEPRAPPGGPASWSAFLGFAGNPNMPTIGEIIEQALTAEEAQLFEAHLRPLVERGEGITRAAVAYLSATKASEGPGGVDRGTSRRVASRR
jgi:ubiquinone/menaquinone biosynthesis C-methylase UbiE